MTSITITDDNGINIIDNVNIKDLSLETKKILRDMLSLKTIDQTIQYEGPYNKLYIRTGEFRCPLKGEYYLSGAIPEAYKALNNLSTEFYIVKLK